MSFRPNAVIPLNSATAGIYIGPNSPLGGYFDGLHHQLNSVFTYLGYNTKNWTLAQWQTMLPAQALTDEIDGLIIQKYWNINPTGGKLLLTGICYSSYEISTNGVQNVTYQGTSRDKSAIIFLNVGGYGITHGRTIAASGLFTMSDMSILCQGGAFLDAHYCNFSGAQQPWSHYMRNVMIEGVNGLYDWWATAGRVRNIRRGLTWYDIITFAHANYVLPSNGFEFETDDPIVADSYNFFNCMTVGYKYGWNLKFDGSSATTCQHEEAQFYNCQSYSGIGLFQANNTNVNAQLSDNYTFIACGWQGIGPAFNIARLQTFYCHDGLFVPNQQITNGNTTWAKIDTCHDIEISCNSFYGVSGTPNGYNIFDISGSDTFGVRIERNNLTMFDVYNCFIIIRAEVPALGLYEQKNFFHSFASPTSGFIVDLSNQQASELRVKSISAQASMDNSGLITYSTTFTATTDSNGNITFYYPTGLFRANPFSIMVCNADASKTIQYPIYSPGNSGGVVVRYPGITAATSVTTSIIVKGDH